MTHSDNMAPLEDGFTGAPSGRTEPSAAADDDGDWVKLFQSANRVATTHHDTKLKTSWARNLRAFQNRHMQGSKYDTYRYSKRSKLFKTKTRSAVRKNIATTAAAIFSTEDVVSVTAERPGDKLQATTARFLHACLNFRLDRTNRWAGPSWFQTVCGARQDTQIQGICVSKQYWEYEERVYETIVDVPTVAPMLDAEGMPVIDLATGEPMMTTVDVKETEQEIEIARDRLMITLIPPEHAKIDPTGDWRDPIQEGGFLIIDFPMRIDDVEHIVKQQADRNPMGGKAWRTVDVKALQTARSERDSEAASVRRARGDGVDRYEQAFRGKDNNIIWLHECFHRRDGEDWHWWMLGESILLSDPRPTIESYPALKGERPYVRGLGEVESHKTHPMAPVESWQQAQMEINDITNLTLDALKMGISPITKIRRGRGVDLKQVQNRGPDAAIMLQDLDDVTFDRSPDPSPNGANYVNILSNDFDELAGVFSGSSVASNRALNETVGGMRMLSTSANALTEYDLRVFCETWMEACLSQCVRLLAYYESDETVIKVAGENAGLIENIGAGEDSAGGLDPKKEEAESEQETVPTEPPITLTQVLENLDNAMVTVKVNVGTGSLDPIQKMQRFMGMAKMSMEFRPGLNEQGKDLNASAFLQEGWGIAGWKNADQFFIKMPKQDEAPPEKVQLKMMDLKGKAESDKLNAQKEMKIAEMGATIDAREIALKEQQFEFQKQLEMLRVGQEQMAQRQNAMMADHQQSMNEQKQILDLLRSMRPAQARA